MNTKKLLDADFYHVYHVYHAYPLNHVFVYWNQVWSKHDKEDKPDRQDEEKMEKLDLTGC